MDFIKCSVREKSVSDDIADRHNVFFPLRACKNFGQKSDSKSKNLEVTWAHAIFGLRVTSVSDYPAKLQKIWCKSGQIQGKKAFRREMTAISSLGSPNGKK